MADNKNAKSFCKQVDSEILYKISTEDVEAFIQRDIDALSKKMGVKPTQISIRSLNLGSKFYPLVLMISSSDLDSNGDDDERTPDLARIAGTEKHHRKVYFPKAVYSAISGYLYNKKDKNAFDSAEWQRAAGVAGARKYNIINEIKLYSKPYSYDDPRTKESYGLVLLDPFRVLFHIIKYDMQLKGDNRRFRLKYDDVKMTGNRDDGTFDYFMKRIIEKKHKNNRGGSIIADISYKMKGR